MTKAFVRSYTQPVTSRFSSDSHPQSTKKPYDTHVKAHDDVAGPQPVKTTETAHTANA